MTEKEYKKKAKQAGISLTRKANITFFLILLVICFFAAMKKYAIDNPNGEIATFFGIEATEESQTGDTVDNSGYKHNPNGVKTDASTDPSSDAYNP